jgi:hypothetical protein
MSPGDTDVLVVSTDRTVQDVTDDWRDGTGALPARLGLVTFSEFDRTAADRPARRPLPGTDITLTTMSDPENLQHLGTTITLHLNDWADDGRDTLIHVDALAPFVEANGPESTFQFLHLLVQTAEQLDAGLVVRLAPSAVDERTRNTLASLFDDVVDPEADAEAAVSLDADTVHGLLGNARRRFVLRSLYAEPTLALDRLATRLACWENDSDEPTSEERNRAYTSLASVHIPRLVEAGVVSFDRDSGDVRLSAAARDADWIEALLDRSPED